MHENEGVWSAPNAPTSSAGRLGRFESIGLRTERIATFRSGLGRRHRGCNAEELLCFFALVGFRLQELVTSNPHLPFLLLSILHFRRVHLPLRVRVPASAVVAMQRSEQCLAPVGFAGRRKPRASIERVYTYNNDDDLTIIQGQEHARGECSWHMYTLAG